MYYSGLECMDDCGVGLGQLFPEGLDCAEVIRIYKQQEKNFKTRSGEHKKRAKANMDRFQKAYEQCQGQPSHRIVEAAGGVPAAETALTPEQIEAAVTASTGAEAPEGVDYGRLGALVAGGVILLGGLIWLAKPKKEPGP